MSNCELNALMAVGDAGRHWSAAPWISMKETKDLHAPQ
jgi:hypothetical protein